MQVMVRTRIAPSPTGEDLHIGNLYTALINWAVARKNKGKFIVRIEDTDRERFVKGAEEKILSSLKAFNLNYDEGPDIGGPFAPYKQSERLPVYQKYIQELIKKGQAYYCFCTKERLDAMRKEQITKKQPPKYDRCCLQNVKNPQEEINKGEKYVIRLKIPDKKEVIFNDLLRGEIKINTNEVDDQVLIKSDGFPTYHFAVVVDDHLMEISHIIRSEEWIASTPKHILLYEAFGWKLPVFAHVPILRNPDRSKLSKRKNPVWVSWYIQEGFLPEAVLNYLGLLGWSHPQEKEIFSIQEFITCFQLKDMNPAGPIYDLAKLTWMNQQYIQMQSDTELKKTIIQFYSKAEELPEEILERLIPLLKTRMETIKDFAKLTDYFFSPPDVKIRNDKEKWVVKELYELLKQTKEWNKDTIFTIFKKIMSTQDIRMPILYYICTGQERGLPLPESLEILGKERTLNYLEKIRSSI
jgi:glutamyl-tRNA synthetase